MNKFGYSIAGVVAGCIAVSAIHTFVASQEKNQQIAKIDKFRTYYDILNQWMKRKSQGEKTEDFFLKKNLNTIAVYGMGEIGERLIDELRDSKVRILFCMESDQPYMNADGTKLSEEVDLESVDAIIVTAVFAFQQIEAKLMQTMKCPILSFEDIIFDE